MITDSTGCEFDAKASNNPSGTVWFGTVIDGEIEEHQMTPDAADELAEALHIAAHRARQAVRDARPEPDPPLPREGFDPRRSWHTDAEM